MESSKATAKHIRQVAGDLLAAHIQLMCHQHTKLLTGNYNKHKKVTKQRCKTTGPQNKHQRNPLISERWTSSLIDASDVVTHHMQKDSNVTAKKFQCKVCHKFGHFTTFCYQKNQQTSGSFNPRKPKAHQLRAGALYTQQDDDDRNESEESNTDESFCLQMKVEKTQLTNPQLPKPVYLMANLVYHLQMHHRQNQYLRARLDMCADVNLMPVAVYLLMLKDPSLKKLTPSTLEIETYMNDVVKIIGSCQLYLVHPDNKKLIQVIFFVAKENRSVLLSCRMTMALGLLKPCA